ncbi:MFS transporter [Actinacidiphila sp. bgisy144]|uniref:MFS transporter n=1 Tax=Actinacidiphila sp. bgisy144 TaxID=3413791 RepID=UPI003EBE5F6D
MTTTRTRIGTSPPPTLPLPALLSLATAVFITCLTEVLPAGLLPAMARDLGVGESAAGQSVTVYAVGTAVTAIPLTAATSGWPRKRLLLVSMAGFCAANTVTALSGSYPLTMAARFVAGVAAGLAWALLAGYARRLAPAGLEGRAIAVAMAGIPVALSVGVPAATYLGKAADWRTAFLVMSGITVLLLGWITVVVPERPGDSRQLGGPAAREEGAGAFPLPADRSPLPTDPTPLPTAPHPLLGAARVPGVAPVLLVTAAFVLAHTLLYTYVAAFLDDVGLGGRTDLVLLVFGAASLLSVWAVGARIHRALRALTLGGVLLVGTAAAVLGAGAHVPALVYGAAALWGLGWGGAPSLLQTAVGEAGGEQADAAQVLLVTLWNVATAAGGILGGLLLDLLGTRALPWTVLVLLVPAFATAAAARNHGFPQRR